jgi:hypothetical protein
MPVFWVGVGITGFAALLFVILDRIGMGTETAR